MAQADQRGMRIVMDLVLNHTSDQHEWFPPVAFRRATIPTATGTCGTTRTSTASRLTTGYPFFGGKGWEWDEGNAGVLLPHVLQGAARPELAQSGGARGHAGCVSAFGRIKASRASGWTCFNVYFKGRQAAQQSLRRDRAAAFRLPKNICTTMINLKLFGALADIRRVLDEYDGTYAVGETFFSTPEKGGRLLRRRPAARHL